MGFDTPGRWVIAFENDDVILWKFGKGAAGADDAQGQIVEAETDTNEGRKELKGELIEDLNENLER